MKKILITGTSGFIGRNLADNLQDDYQLLTPSHRELDLLDNVAVQQYIRREQPEYIVHSAIQGTLGLPDACQSVVLRNNLQMFFHLQRMSGYFGKMFYFGSGAEYGKAAYIPKMNEEYFDTAVPADDYGLSKYAMAKAIVNSHSIYDLRLFAVFGPYENYNYRFISNCLCKALENRDIVIHQNVFFDYLYVKDLCQIIRWFLTHEPKFHYYNICTGNAIDIHSLAQKAVKAAGSSSRIVVENERLGKEYSGDNTRLLTEMGRYEFTDIDTAIQELLQFYQDTHFELSGDY